MAVAGCGPLSGLGLAVPTLLTLMGATWMAVAPPLLLTFKVTV